MAIKKPRLARPRLRARKLSIAGKSSYSGGGKVAFKMPSPSLAAFSGGPMAGGGGLSQMPPDAAFSGAPDLNEQ